MSAEEKFNIDGRKHATTLYDELQAAKKEYGDQTNFGAYRLGRDPQYLGIIGNTYFAKPWGNDSSNIQSIMSGQGYWNRVYYRPNVEEQFAKQDAANAAAANKGAAAASGSEGSMKKAASEGSLSKAKASSAEKPLGGYARIKQSMKPIVESAGKPKIQGLKKGERLDFFNTMGNKYHMQGGGRNIVWNTCKTSHTSSKNEIKFIQSQYFRTDTLGLLRMASEPTLAAATTH